MKTPRLNTHWLCLQTTLRAGAVVLWLTLTSSLAAASYTVVNTADNEDPGSLRWAINHANANGGPDAIEFNIPDSDPNYDGSGVWVIRLGAGLGLADPSGGTTIDGRSQLAAPDVPNPDGLRIRIEYDSAVTDAALHLFSDGNRLFSLNIDGGPWTAIWIRGANNWVAGCYIGTDPSGVEVFEGQDHGIGIAMSYGRAHNNIIGTNADGVDDHLEGNLISGCYRGVELNGDPWLEYDPDGYYSGRPRGNWIAGNLIGVDRTGTKALGTGQDPNGESTGHGVMINGAIETLVGTNGDGASDHLERNIISASDDSNVMIRHPGWEEELWGGDGNVIAGNYIGTDITGVRALPREDTPDGYSPPCSGVIVMMGSKHNRIERNVISGHLGDNPSVGVLVFGLGTDQNTVQANLIGTDAEGTAALGNTHEGVVIAGGARGNRIEANVVSGNAGFGGVFLGDPETQGNTIVGNLIGTDVTGRYPISNASVGIAIWDSPNNLVQGNVISGNVSSGIMMSGTAADHNRLFGNLIGVDSTGTAPLGNGRGHHPWALEIHDGAHENFIGTDGDGVDDATEGNVMGGPGGIWLSGPTTTRNKVAGNFVGTDRSGTLRLTDGYAGVPGIVIWEPLGNFIGTDGDGVADDLEGNVIAFKDTEGVVVRPPSSTQGNSIRGNSIYGNGALGIDLSVDENKLTGDGATLNDALDADDGPNGLQNFPVVTSATSTSSATTIHGTLHSAPDAEFTLDFYANPACDVSGYGQGERYLGWTTLATGAAGDAAFTVRVPAAAPVGWVITATATDADGNTSEFSDCSPPVVAGVIQVAIDIKPSSDPNSINLGSKGTVPVAILSSADFDAATVDPATVRLAGAPVKLRGKAAPMASFEDVDRDGRLDLVVHVQTQDLRLAVGDVEATLTGATFDGTPIEGSDAVRIMGKQPRS